MAMDGIVISNIVWELKKNWIGARIDKIYQPEKDEIMVQLRNQKHNGKLLLSANPSYPRLQITEANKQNPKQAPLFSMVLRKHLSGGRIVDFQQPDFERVVHIEIESHNELGDLTTKFLIIEIMGKHSNIILVQDHTIIDSIKHISFETSSVREVLPGKRYFLPASGKTNPLLADYDTFARYLTKNSLTLQKSIYNSFNGVSPIVASEIIERSQIDHTSNPETLAEAEMQKLFDSFSSVMKAVRESHYAPFILINDKNGSLKEFFSIPMSIYGDAQQISFETIFQLLDYFYDEKDRSMRMSQKTASLRKLLQNNLERCLKKREMQDHTVQDLKNKDMIKKYGELLTAHSYELKKGMTTVKLQDFYSDSKNWVEIPLDGQLTPMENAQKYFQKYNKAKRTLQALDEQRKQNNEEIVYLEAVLNSIDSAATEKDIQEIKEELFETGYIKNRPTQKNKGKEITKPLKFISSDSFVIYVGKNNKQNDEVTLKIAHSNDIWLHTKNIPGSHVIIQTKGQQKPPEKTLEEAASLAAYYSKGKENTKVPVDYTLKKYVKKPSGAKPGMVIYTDQKTLYVKPDSMLDHVES